METVWNLDWREYPSAAALAIGVLIALRGIVAGSIALRMPVGRPGKNWLIIRGIRRFLFGSSLAAVAAGWWLHWPAMVTAGAVIGFEETIETSIAASALRAETERDLRQAR